MGRGISKLKCGITEFKIVYTYFYDSLGKSLWPINPTSGILIFSKYYLKFSPCSYRFQTCVSVNRFCYLEVGKVMVDFWD